MTMQREDVTNDLFGLVGTFPRPGWIVLDAARSHRFTGELVFETLPVVTVYLDRGEIYLAERITDPPLGSRLIDAGAINTAQLEHGSIRVGEVAHLGRLFERVPSVNRHTVLVMTEMMTEECVGWLAGQLVRNVTSTPYRHHPAGIRRWTQSPRALDLSPGDPLPSPEVGDAAIPAPPPEPLFTPLEAFDDDVITWDEPSWLDERPRSGRDRPAVSDRSDTDLSGDAAAPSSVFDSMPLLPTRVRASSGAEPGLSTDEPPFVDWPPTPPKAAVGRAEPTEPGQQAAASEPTMPIVSQLSAALDSHTSPRSLSTPTQEPSSAPAVAPFDLDRRSPRGRPDQRSGDDPAGRGSVDWARSAAADVSPSPALDTSPDVLPTRTPAGAPGDGLSLSEWVSRLDLAVDDTDEAGLPASDRAREAMPPDAPVSEPASAPIHGSGSSTGGPSAQAEASRAPVDRFEVIWPSGEVDGRLGIPAQASTTDRDLDQNRTVPSGSTGEPTDEAGAALPGAEYDAGASVAADDGSEVSDDVVLAVRRAVATIETGSLATRRRLAETSPATDLSRGVDAPSDRSVSSTPPGRRVMQHEWAPGVNLGRRASDRSVFDEGVPVVVPEAVPAVVPEDLPVPVLPPVDASAASGRSSDPPTGRAERVGALRRLIGSLRRQ